MYIYTTVTLTQMNATLVSNVLLTNEQHVSPATPDHVHQEFLGFSPPIEIELQELHSLLLNCLNFPLRTGQKPQKATTNFFIKVL